MPTPVTYQLTCDEPWFTYIREGLKPVEGRKNSPKYHHIRPGDFIQFSNGNNHFLTQVTQVRSYQSLDEYLLDVTIAKALPNVSSFEEAIKIYHQWSTPDEIREHGFLGISVIVCDKIGLNSGRQMLFANFGSQPTSDST